MPQEPIILPLVIAGIALGSLLASGKHSVSKKKLFGISALSGLLNLGNAYLVYLFFPPPASSQASSVASQLAQLVASTAAESESAFYAASFIVGVLVVLIVVGAALAYARFKAPEADEEEKEDMKPEEDESPP